MLRILLQKEEALVSTTSDMDLSTMLFCPSLDKQQGSGFQSWGGRTLRQLAKVSLFVPWNMKIRRNFNRRSKQGTNSQERELLRDERARCLPASGFKIWNIKLHGLFMMLKLCVDIKGLVMSTRILCCIREPRG